MTGPDPLAAAMLQHRDILLPVADLAALRDVEAELRAALKPYGEDTDDFPERPADRGGIQPYAADAA